MLNFFENNFELCDVYLIKNPGHLYLIEIRIDFKIKYISFRNRFFEFVSRVILLRYTQITNITSLLLSLVHQFFLSQNISIQKGLKIIRSNISN